MILNDQQKAEAKTYIGRLRSEADQLLKERREIEREFVRQVRAKNEEMMEKHAEIRRVEEAVQKGEWPE